VVHDGLFHLVQLDWFDHGLVDTELAGAPMPFMTHAVVSLFVTGLAGTRIVGHPRHAVFSDGGA
jgi:hypothetical protein